MVENFQVKEGTLQRRFEFPKYAYRSLSHREMLNWLKKAEDLPNQVYEYKKSIKTAVSEMDTEFQKLAWQNPQAIEEFLKKFKDLDSKFGISDYPIQPATDTSTCDKIEYMVSQIGLYKEKLERTNLGSSADKENKKREFASVDEMRKKQEILSWYWKNVMARLNGVLEKNYDVELKGQYEQFCKHYTSLLLSSKELQATSREIIDKITQLEKDGWSFGGALSLIPICDRWYNVERSTVCLPAGEKL